MKNSHTSGSWEIKPEECDRAYIRIRGTALGGRYKIANVLTPIYEGSHHREAEETRANARLIAAAPDMKKAGARYLAAEMATIGMKPYETHLIEELQMARADFRAAIAKANGE